MNSEKMRQAFSGELFPEDNGFYAKMDGWQLIYEGSPDWRSVKRAGLGKGGKRRMNMLNTAKILCDEFAHKCFAEQVDISCGSEEYDRFILDFLDREGFWKNIPHLLSAGVRFGNTSKIAR